jgi:hypothetical protein
MGHRRDISIGCVRGTIDRGRAPGHEIRKHRSRT